MENISKLNLEALINELDEGEKVSVFNAYCEQIGYYDDMAYLIEEIDEFWEGRKPSEVLSIFQDISLNDSYYSFDGYGYAYSYGTIEDNGCWYPYNIAEYAIENDNDFYNSEIREYLDKLKEE